MKTYWISTEKMTATIIVNKDNIIIDSAPIFKKFIGQDLYRFDCWLEACFKDIRVIELGENDVKSN